MKKLTSVALAVAMATAALSAQASEAMSGPNVGFIAQGNIGEVVMNPYDIAPLTAVIRNGGYTLEDATVRIVPKKDGQEIKYNVSKRQLLTHGGIPVFGLYPDYVNTVEVTYTRNDNGKKEKFSESYTMYAPAVFQATNGIPSLKSSMFKTKVNKADPAFGDRLYLVNNLMQNYAKASRIVWNNPNGGALQWNFYPQNAIIDTKGEVRWYMHVEPIYDVEDPYRSGVMMGFQQDQDGNITWGYGQRYAKYDLLGREIYNRRLPSAYADFSHSFDNAQNGHAFLRVSSADYRRPDGKRVHTVRDVILELDEQGQVYDEWKLWESLDPWRDVVLKTMDQGAVCLNIDASKSGQTLSAEDLAKMDESDQFGDITGAGPGRNWAHVNSVDYDPTDDSIIISSRHQSAIVKIGRDKKVKWILATPTGWNKDLLGKVLTPVDSKGKKIKCENNQCEGGFDWTWTQHTAFRIDEKSNKDIVYITAFDNGDGRHLEQPAIPSMKYSRAVVFKIDQKKMTVQQIWEYGKERGNEWYSPVTSLTKYYKDKDSVFVYSATAGMGAKFTNAVAPNPFIEEFKWGAKEPSVEIQLLDTMGYQAMPISVEKAFNTK